MFLTVQSRKVWPRRIRTCTLGADSMR